VAEQTLADIKVVDLVYDIAGPYCTKLPSDLGGAVTKA
jgi:crotonobetainyl-CoA:carnitine CoA-transferase CaiB-like acyl-CoA transferase